MSARRKTRRKCFRLFGSDDRALQQQRRGDGYDRRQCRRTRRCCREPERVGKCSRCTVGKCSQRECGGEGGDNESPFAFHGKPLLWGSAPPSSSALVVEALKSCRRSVIEGLHLCSSDGCCPRKRDRG